MASLNSGQAVCSMSWAELDLDLLATPLAVQTRWYVITGAPSCGKTTLVDQLAGRGYRTVPEIARQYLEGEVARGRAIAEIRADMDFCTRQVLDMQRRIEDALPAGELLFVDRGLPDCLAFFRLAGVDPNDHLAACLRHRYAGVFLLDPLPFERDGTRMENDAVIAPYLEAWHARDYLALGYDVVRVPVLPPPERLAYVLGRLAE